MTMYILSFSHTIALYPTPEERLVISKRKFSPIFGQLIIMVVSLPGQFIISCALPGTTQGKFHAVYVLSQRLQFRRTDPPQHF